MTVEHVMEKIDALNNAIESAGRSRDLVTKEVTIPLYVVDTLIEAAIGYSVYLKNLQVEDK